jgi:hypothetical protein
MRFFFPLEYLSSHNLVNNRKKEIMEGLKCADRFFSTRETSLDWGGKRLFSYVSSWLDQTKNEDVKNKNNSNI